MRTPKVLDKGAHILTPGEGERRQLETGDPPFRMSLQDGDVFFGKGMRCGLAQKAGGFFPGKTQIPVADLEQLPTHAPASEGKFGIDARGEDQVKIAGKMIEEEQ